MKKAAKVLGIIGLVIPRAEEDFGRRVDVAGIDIGLLSGITIRDFSVKEEDGQADFVKTKAFGRKLTVRDTGGRSRRLERGNQSSRRGEGRIRSGSLDL